LFSSRIPAPPASALFPYTTLFRSQRRTVGCHSAPLPSSMALFRWRLEHHLAHSHPRFLLLSRSGPPDGLRIGGLFHHSCVIPGSDRKSTRLNSSHVAISYAVFCLK